MENLNIPKPQRLKILGDDEIDALFGLPRFTERQRVKFFSVSIRERTVLEELGTIQSKICFLLQLGYFKDRQMFFTFEPEDVHEDIEYILATYFPKYHPSSFNVSRNTRARQQRLILELCSYNPCDLGMLEDKARKAARICGKPIFVFREIIQAMTDQRTVFPAYSSLQNIVGKALNHEQDRMKDLIRKHLVPSDVQALDQLIHPDSGSYEITQLKREPKDFSASEIKREVERGKQILQLYRRSKIILPVLGLSNESIKYFSSLVTYYSVFRLRRFDPGVVHVYLLCFIHHRYQRHHDNLLASLIHSVRKFSDRAKESARQRVYEHRVEKNGHLRKAGQILRLFIDDEISGTDSFDQVRAKAFSILDRDDIEAVASHITTQASFDETAFQWDCLESMAAQFKRHLRPIVRALDFNGAPAQSQLIRSLQFLQEAVSKGRSLASFPESKIPAGVIGSSLKRYLYDPSPDPESRNQLNPNRYEFLVYRLLRDRLEAGDLFCRDSVRFRSFEDDLVDAEQWKTNRDRLIESAGLPLLKQPIHEHLASLEEELESLLERVNKRVESGDNKHFKIKKRGSQTRWSLPYPGGSEESRASLFDTVSQVDISRVLDFANRQCQWMEPLEHVLHRYVKREADTRVITACILAWGTNMGLGTMGQISDIGYHALMAGSDNFIRLETLREANDRITNATSKMPLFRSYDINDSIHSSSDGQKFETGINTINARHSPKYFGLKKGVVSYTLVANHIPLNARIIGANEHESHYVFDILFNNSSQVQPDLHSTDTHGTNEVNFALLHLFGYQFAPRYRDVFEKVSTSLYGFKHPNRYQGLIKPVRKINKKTIIESWDSAQRILVSLALKTTTQNIIVGKLNAYPRRNKTRQALWEYDNIIKSLYLLRYIDSSPLRRNVQKALNRGESYHQLRRAVSYANFGKLRFKTEYEQQVWGECSRLITNCIIYYNTTILSRLLDHAQDDGNKEWAGRIVRASPVAWQHINFFGRYEFGKPDQPIDMVETVQQLARTLKK
ncbi:Transposase and inactivated derivatives, TnpA family [Rubritalea squalenifaciens DSM 18772]|uniref:Transposase and inactivated derivatives, TnpA family n=1 Tax=Rubritalea squalenifaciens DSM 18772 TaxID=1123071 RepID=A0A1M6IB54_9BACT|nr:Tn3 family transposase [Rubritalea squalenifaciens]SHJ31671.1 Transposase and inactivated derivatives, TnpA family [Rubritalea squalenifaciens DSM 18772]